MVVKGGAVKFVVSLQLGPDVKGEGGTRKGRGPHVSLVSNCLGGKEKKPKQFFARKEDDGQWCGHP